MEPHQQKFVNYWREKRKQWSWKKHSYKTFVNMVLPLVLTIDLVNYFVIGDTAYIFFTFGHLFIFLRNLLVLAFMIILGSGFIDWIYNENKYWNILRKNTDKLQ